MWNYTAWFMLFSSISNNVNVYYEGSVLNVTHLIRICLLEGLLFWVICLSHMFVIHNRLLVCDRQRIIYLVHPTTKKSAMTCSSCCLRTHARNDMIWLVVQWLCQYFRIRMKSNIKKLRFYCYHDEKNICAWGFCGNSQNTLHSMGQNWFSLKNYKVKITFHDDFS